jgi:hypothetical protein
VERHVDWYAMTKQYARLAMAVLLFALLAFVANVLSPLTPTPMAQLMAKTCAVALLSLLVFFAFICPVLTYVEQFACNGQSPVPAVRNSRRLINLICILRC